MAQPKGASGERRELHRPHKPPEQNTETHDFRRRNNRQQQQTTKHHQQRPRLDRREAFR